MATCGRQGTSEVCPRVSYMLISISIMNIRVHGNRLFSVVTFCPSYVPEELALQRPSYIMGFWDVSLIISCILLFRVFARCLRGFLLFARESGDPSKAKDCLPDKSKQFLVTRNGERKVHGGFA